MALSPESHDWCIIYRPYIVSSKSHDHGHDATNRLHLSRLSPRPSKTWKGVISDDIKSWTIPVDSCQDRSKWRKNMNDSMAKSNPWLHG